MSWYLGDQVPDGQSCQPQVPQTENCHFIAPEAQAQGGGMDSQLCTRAGREQHLHSLHQPLAETSLPPRLHPHGGMVVTRLARSVLTPATTLNLIASVKTHLQTHPHPKAVLEYKISPHVVPASAHPKPAPCRLLGQLMSLLETEACRPHAALLGKLRRRGLMPGQGQQKQMKGLGRDVGIITELIMKHVSCGSPKQ